MRIKIFYILIFFLLTNSIHPDNSPPGSFTITRIKYKGGGDWYSDPSSLPNLLNYIKKNTNIIINPLERRAEIGDDIFSSSSYLYLTGHGNIKLNDEETHILRDHLLSGAFLHVDDNYGLDKSFRREIKKVFPEKDWVELPLSHPIFNIYFKFPNGLPKIHEHNNERPQALALFNKGKIMVLYTFESDLGDGWEDAKVHNDSQKIRNDALKMGTNIILFALSR
tara:strand:+ start:1866 stop:2534 length:669 start_codon:yes stop_codon:yes gene_type:complete